MGIQSLTEQLSGPKLIQLVIIICGYLFMRQQFTKFMKNKTLRAQLEKDKKDKIEELIDRPENLPMDPISVSDRSWGWGKPTRRKVQRQQKILEERLEEAARLAQEGELGPEDDDIREFLED